ncbi:MAG: PAS domain S-box protein [Gemmatimonadales bacterium]
MPSSVPPPDDPRSGAAPADGGAGQDADRTLQESRDRFQQLAEHLDQVFWMTDPAKQEMLYISPGYERIWGRSRESLYADAQGWVKAIHPEDRAEVESMLPAQVEGTYRVEYRIVHPDGTVRWIADRAVPVRNPAGEVYRVIGVAEDITERKRLEQELRASEAARRGVWESALDAVMIMDHEGLVTDLNPAAEEIFGYPRAVALGRALAELIIPPGLRARHQAGLKHYLATGEGPILNTRMELSALRADGSEFPTELTIVAVTGGPHPTFIGTLRDITERRRVEEALLVSRAASEQDARNLQAINDELTAVLDASPIAILVADRDGIIQRWSRSAEEIFGWSADEAIGQLCPTVPEDGMDDYRAMVRRALDEGIRSFQLRWRRKRSGERRQVEIHAAPLSAARGGLGEVVLMLQDVSDRVTTELALRESEERYRSLVEGARDGIFTLSPEGVIISANSAVAILTGWPLAEWIGRSFAEVIHRDDVARAMDVFQSVMAGDTPASPTLELRLLAADGRALPVELTTTPKRLGDQVIGILAIGRDVRERHRMEEQLRQSQKIDSIGRLAAGVAHDFNNLLTVQQAHLALLLMERELPASVVEHLQEIAEATDRAAALTRQLMLFSRKRVVQRRRLQLDEVVVTLSRMLDRLVGEDVTIELACEADLPPIEGDPSMMEQVLMNLVVNARDAMPTGGRIEISTRALELDASAGEAHAEARPGRFVCLTVADTGSGIAPEVMERLFEPFFTTKDIGRGTGLGLSTVHGIVKQHDGWVEVVSAPDAGSAFRLFLPVAEGVASAPDADQPPPALRGGSETILAVEDEESLRRIVTTVLERYGYRVLVAADGLEALELWRTHGGSVDLLLTDLVMPHGLSGWDLAERLRAERPTLRVLVMSGYDPEERGLGHQARGADLHHNFLPKPYVPSELARAVRDCLDRQG